MPLAQLGVMVGAAAAAYATVALKIPLPEGIQALLTSASPTLGTSAVHHVLERFATWDDVIAAAAATLSGAAAAVVNCAPVQLAIAHALALAACAVCLVGVGFLTRTWLALLYRQTQVYATATVVIAQILFLKYWYKHFPAEDKDKEDEAWDRLHTKNARRVQVCVQRVAHVGWGGGR